MKAFLVLTALLLVSLAAEAAQMDPASFSDLHWRLIGPFRGGRSLTVTGVPGKPDLFYFGAVGGGVWKSDDAGTTWKPIFDSQPIASIGAIAVAASDPNIIYVGTGEADMRSDISYGNGIYKSTDGGAHWTHIGLIDSRQIGRIIVDPHDPNRVFVAALGHAYGPNQERGVFRSVDGGNSWQRVLFKDADTGAIDLAFAPNDTQIVFASLWQTRRPPWNVYPPSNGPGSGLYRSSDGGNTWQPITRGLPTEGLGRIGIAVAPSDPKRVYLCMDAKQGGVYRSDDAGESFSLVDNDRRLWQRGWYFGGITVDTHNPDIVYIANTSSYRSRDGGKTFEAFKGAPGGDDYHSIWISPDNSDHIAIASDQGTVISLNGGATWSSWYNQPTGQMYHVATDNRFPYWVYGAQQDSGAMMVPSRTHFAHISEHDWRPLSAGGESGEIAPDPTNDNIVFGGTTTKYFLDTAQEQEVSPTLGLPGTFRRTWTLPLTFSTSDPHALYVSHQQIFRSTDGGQSWQQISPDLTRPEPGTPATLDAATAKDANTPDPRRGVVYSVAPSRLSSTTVWAGTDDGLIHLTTDNGKSWKDVTPASLSPWSKVGSLEASHFNNATAYAAIDRHRLEDYRPHILRTHDLGKTWTAIASGISDGAFVNVVREDPKRKGLLYAGTELGVYVSFDDGDHCQPLQLNLPVTSVRDIEVHGDDLVIATHGRAFWIMDDISPLREVSAFSGAHLFQPQTAFRVRPGSDEGTPQPPETPKADNPPAGALLDYFLPSNGSGPLLLEISTASGQPVRRWSSEDHAQPIDPKSIDIPMYWFPTPTTLSAAPGHHRWVWDMHYAAPEGAPVRRRRGGGAGPWAPPGEYIVKLSWAGQTLQQRLTLRPDPRVRVPQSVYDEQFATSMRALEDAAKLAPTLQQASELLSTLRSAQGNVASSDDLASRLERLLGPAATGLGPEGADNITLRSLSAEFAAIAASTDSADAAVTVTTKNALRNAEQQLPALLQQWQTLRAQLQNVKD